MLYFVGVVCDTGDFESMKRFSPEDATTNPSLILKAATQNEYKHLVDNAVSYAKQNANTFEEQLSLAMDKVSVRVLRYEYCKFKYYIAIG